MEARKRLIDQAMAAAFLRVTSGQLSGCVLDNQPTDVSELLRGAGFTRVDYDHATGRVTADWSPTSPEEKKKGTLLEERLRRIAALAAEARRWPHYIALWKQLEHRWQALDRGTVTLALHATEECPALPTADDVRAILGAWGLAVVTYNKDDGDFNDGSGMGGWNRHPSVTIVCRFA